MRTLPGAWLSYAVPARLFVDRERMVAVAQVGQVAAPCYCYAETLLHPIALPEAALAAIDARSASVAVDED